jgi:hypothetical protein
MKTKLVLLFLIPVILTGCGLVSPLYVPYNGKYGFGYTDNKIENDRFQVTYDGNLATETTTAINYLLYRCAELTVENGFDYFTVVKQTDEKWELTSLSYGSGNGSVSKTSMPHFIYMIRCGKGEKPNGDNVYNAKEVMKNLEPTIKREKSKK